MFKFVSAKRVEMALGASRWPRLGIMFKFKLDAGAPVADLLQVQRLTAPEGPLPDSDPSLMAWRWPETLAH